MDAPWFAFVLGALATWRVAHLLAHEDGPWDAVFRLRLALGDGPWGRVLDCFHCLSLWVAAPLALAVARSPLDWLLAWLALSGAACLLERLGGPSAPLHSGPALPGEDDVLLRTEAPGAGVDRDERPLGEPEQPAAGSDSAAGPTAGAPKP